MVLGPFDENAAINGAGFIPNLVDVRVMEAFGNLIDQSEIML